MTFTRFLGVGVFAWFLIAHSASADTIIQSAGNSEASEPLGFYAPYAADGITPIVYAVEWSQTATYTNVDVTANLFTPGSSGSVNYALVTAIGPGSSFAADGIVRGSAVTPANPTDVDLFHLNSLGPGTYYLVLDSSVPDTSSQYNFPIQGNYTTASGVTFLGDDWAGGAAINSGYTPASNFDGTILPVEFAVTGRVATAPEPATAGLVALSLITVGIVSRRLCPVAIARRAKCGRERRQT